LPEEVVLLPQTADVPEGGDHDRLTDSVVALNVFMTIDNHPPTHGSSTARRFVRNLAWLAFLLVCGSQDPVLAQTVEITPLAGYRFGNDLFELAANRSVDTDGGPVVGAAVNVGLWSGLSFEGLFAHQQASVSGQTDALAPVTRVRVVVDQYLAGGRQDFGAGRARPFLTGLLGFTRYAADGDNEIRFAVSAGGGAHLALQRRLGVRVESRVFTTFVDADVRGGACGPRVCLVGLHVNVAWQIEFTAGLVAMF
jgi:hypothetical protein